MVYSPVDFDGPLPMENSKVEKWSAQVRQERQHEMDFFDQP